jgi:predicted MFS family arabinose efflux permease
MTGSIGILGWFVPPRDRLKEQEKPKLDVLGAGLSTGGLILLSFVLSSGGIYGWSKAFVIALLVALVAFLVIFTWVETKVSNPIMPLSLWKLKNFAALWIAGFVVYGGYQTFIYYTALIAQEVEHLGASATTIRYLPIGLTGFTFSLLMGRAVEMFNVKHLLLTGMALCAVAPVSAITTTDGDTNFWKHVFPTTVLGVAGTTIVYCIITVVLLGSVPTNVKSLCGGMVNPAFQIGSGVGLALSSAVVQAVDTSRGHSKMKQYETGLLCCVGLGLVGFMSALGVRDAGKVKRGREST